VLFPVRLVEGGWPDAVQRRLRRFVWPDPRRVRDPGLDPLTYSRLMAAFAVGPTRKITGPGRHTAADSLLLQHVDLTGAVIADIGASDGITSVELVERIGAFRQYVIADLFLTLDAVDLGRQTVFSDQDGRVVLVAGPRLLAWPGESRVVRWLSEPIVRRARPEPRRPGPAATTLLLVNPITRALLERDPRVRTQVHDIFGRWVGPPPDVIKVANLLRRLYFSDEQIAAALDRLVTDLRDGGHLLLVDNPRSDPAIEVRGCLYRRTGDRFRLVARTDHLTEVHELVLRARVRHPKEPY